MVKHPELRNNCEKLLAHLCLNKLEEVASVPIVQ